jgi:hypothetical protein
VRIGTPKAKAIGVAVWSALLATLLAGCGGSASGKDRPSAAPAAAVQQYAFMSQRETNGMSELLAWKQNTANGAITEAEYVLVNVSDYGTARWERYDLQVSPWGGGYGLDAMKDGEKAPGFDTNEPVEGIVSGGVLRLNIDLSTGDTFTRIGDSGAFKARVDTWIRDHPAKSEYPEQDPSGT